MIPQVLPAIASLYRLMGLSSKSAWDSNPFADATHAMSAARSYYQQEQDDLRPMQPTTSDIKIIMAGVQSCILAHQVLSIKWSDPEGTAAQLATESARVVLKYWGIEIKSVEQPTTKPSPDPAPTPTPAEMIWPPVHLDGRPRFSALPDVYKENYYHVYEVLTTADASGETAFMVNPEDLLVLQKAYWSEEALQWRLLVRFTRPTGDEFFWINHCQVKPGEEIGAATEHAPPESAP